MTTDTGARAVQIARQWLGTPYRHQGSVLGAGADCLGLIRGIWRGLYGAEPLPVPPYTRDWSEPGGHEVLWQALDTVLRAKPVTEAALGDVILFRMKSGAVAKHLGVQTCVGARDGFIHAYWGHGVVDSPLSPPWARRIVARFAFPDGE